MKLVTSAQMRTLEEKAAQRGITTELLMENAGLAVAQEARRLLANGEARRFLVLVGPGNNGGDGLVAARHLADWGATVEVYSVRRRGPDDRNEAQLIERNVPVLAADEDPDYRQLQQALEHADVVIDALLGTGVSRPITGVIADILDRLQRTLETARDSAPREEPLTPRVLAVDLPSGLNADTGAVDPHTVRADVTVALGFAKVGTHLPPGSFYIGQERVVDIGLPAEFAAELPVELLRDAWVHRSLPPRPDDANKGTFGKLLVVAGSSNYVGAPALCCWGAYRVGTGLVTLACLESLHPILAAKLTETTFLLLPDTAGGHLSGDTASLILRALRDYDVLLIGPGIGTEPVTQAFLHIVLFNLYETGIRAAVVDADGLNALARSPGWWEQVHVPLVVTPHPGEMARLTGMTVKEIQANRLTVALRYAAQWGVTLILKGANTVIAAPDGQARLSPFANAALASAGTGDILAGAVAGLLCQGLEPFDAAACGVYIHGMAGQHLRDELGAAGLLASDLLPVLPRVLKQLRGGDRPLPPDRPLRRD